MAKANVRKEDRGDGADFINEKRAVDGAVNERIKEENESNRLDPRSANSPTRTEYEPKDSTKKSGRTKH